MAIEIENDDGSITTIRSHRSQSRSDTVAASIRNEEADVKQSLKDIMRFVEEIDKTEEVGYEIIRNRNGDVSLKRLKLGRAYHRKMGDMLSACMPGRWFAPPIQAFLDTSVELGIVRDSSFHAALPSAPYGTSRKTHAELFNELIVGVRARCRTKKFRAEMRYRRRKERRNRKKAVAFERAMFKQSSRYLVLVLTVNFPIGCRDKITFADMREYRDRFLRDRRMNSLLRGISGILWKIECGVLSGLHMHLIVFYSAEHRRDVHIAQRLGEYWKNEVTKGKGTYWNSNSYKDLHERHGHGVGTGTINRFDPKRDALLMNTLYLAKADLCLVEKDGDRSHAFGTTQVKEKKKAGRPRDAGTPDWHAEDFKSFANDVCCSSRCERRSAGTRATR